MIINSGTIRTSYTSLTVVTSIEVLTPLSPNRQVFNAESGEYEPDREITPLILLPFAQADTEDGSWKQRNVNRLLANMVWKANGLPLQKVPRFAGKFEIESSGEEKGKLTIFANIPPSESWELSFEAVVSDARTNMNMPTRSGSIILSTADKSKDGWELALDCESSIYYNPFLDALLLHDYLVGNGESSVYPSLNNSYKRTINTLVTKASVVAAPNTYSVVLHEVVNGRMVEAIGNVEVVSVSNAKIELDLRVIEKKQYVVVLFHEGGEVSRESFSVERLYPSFESQLTRVAPMAALDSFVHNGISISYDSSVIERPEYCMNFRWWSTTSTKPNLMHNAGTKTIISKYGAGVGNTAADSYIDIDVEGGLNTSSMVAEENGDFFTEENGDLFIIE